MRDNELITPPINGSNLQGLTRGSVLQLAQEMAPELTVRVEPICREALYMADELFFTGTATGEGCTIRASANAH